MNDTAPADESQSSAHPANDHQRIYRYIDPLSLPTLDAKDFRLLDGVSGVCIEQPDVVRTFLRYAPEFIDDPDATGLFSSLAAAVYTSPPNFIASASDAKIVGYRAVLWSDRFYVDQSHASMTDSFLAKIAKPLPFENEDTRLRPAGDADLFTLEDNRQPHLTLNEVAVNLTSMEPSNYGSFLFRVLPKVEALRDLDLLDLPFVAYAVNESYLRLLELAGLSRDKIVRHDTHIITSVARLITPSQRNPGAFLDYKSREICQRIVRAVNPVPTERGKLYISRAGHAKRGGSTRVMVNEDALIERLASLGFEIFSPEENSADEQVVAFSSASMVVGPSGGGMFNTVFCRPGTKVIDIESEEDWIYAHTGLFASSSLRYGIFVGKVDIADPAPVHRRWSVNIDALLNRISEFTRS